MVAIFPVIRIRTPLPFLRSGLDQRVVNLLASGLVALAQMELAIFSFVFFGFGFLCLFGLFVLRLLFGSFCCFFFFGCRLLAFVLLHSSGHCLQYLGIAGLWTCEAARLVTLSLHLFTLL